MKSLKKKKEFSHLLSNLRRRAMKMPGMTMSPSPNMAKLEAPKPFSSKSWGNTTAKKKKKKKLMASQKKKKNESNNTKFLTVTDGLVNLMCL